ncbi:hypothetical protein G6F46_000209 [Rhizopus delemar]|uniref:Reverse transcriptase zinc-binding domain-containing protein n=2 Tax=Rhizopus TaxID=4842 RepID=A0A9P6ZC99_9FUNG|nr:hypothetical protein G6F55_000230 [Rhizopus delemar]KAG1552061.1 hypothetical protein G6F51_001460 [Rhizopus arrhizus]KAG1504291.1 hypothetical protein G6F54_001106 [Rhizopus delemar]KAG1517558.1 hypothetical protein G6F53_001278 [Rhizopus delemar]KAG1528645.1 hypothetical protein G6F52_000454 [Rhizopus delemar]
MALNFLLLDAPANPEVGPNVVSFDLSDSSKAKTAVIFIKESAWKEAVEIAQNHNAASIAPYDLIYQLRQLRTRFHQQSTYFLCRASNETVDNLAARPYTVYTLAEWDNGNDNADYRTASKLFQTIATNAICGNPRLEKHSILSLCRELKVKGTAVYGSRRLLRPPYRVAPGLRLPVSSWKEFWAFNIPSSAFTPWWRLLHDSLPVAYTLHPRNVTSCASPVCRICHNDVEDTFHFVVGCQLKWQFWSSVLSLFHLTDQFPDAASVWSAFATLSSPDNRYTICSDHIRPLGFAFSSLWKFHWRCVLNGTLWSLSGAMNFFQANQSVKQAVLQAYAR